MLKKLLAAALLAAFTANHAFAQCATGVPCSPPPSGGGVSVPGPIAGAGIGYLIIAGGYYAFRRWRRK